MKNKYIIALIKTFCIICATSVFILLFSCFLLFFSKHPSIGVSIILITLIVMLYFVILKYTNDENSSI